jgi:cell division protease FtsH
MERRTQVNIWYFILALLAVIWVRDLWVASQHVEEITYSQFQRALEQGRIEEVTILGDRLRGKYKSAAGEAQEAADEAQAAPDKGPHQFVTPRISLDLARELERYGVEFTGVAENPFFGQILSWVLPAVFFIAIWMYVFPKLAQRQGGMGSMMSVGKSKARVYMEKDTKVTFDDVAGVDEAERELQEIVEFLKEPQRYGRLGARAPKGGAAGRPARYRQDTFGTGRRR